MKYQFPELLLVQDAVSGCDSVRAIISDSVYRLQGLGVFDIEKIPYSSGTSFVSAKKLVDTIAGNLQLIVDTKGEIHFYEFGAGTGVLSKKILDYISHRYNKIYSHLTLHISDISIGSIAAVRALGIFKDHNERIVFDVMDAGNPDFPTAPDLIFHSYLYDSFPTRHFEVTKNGDIFEILITTKIPCDSTIIDTSMYPPKVLNVEEIKQVLVGGDKQRQLLLAGQLLYLLRESTTLIPVETLGYEGSDLEDLRNFASSLHGEGRKQFNYSFLAVRSNKRAINALDNNGMIYISDFGSTNVCSRVRKYEQFGNVIACPLSFPVLAYSAVSNNATYTITKHAENQPQHILTTTLPKIELHRCFDVNCREHGGECVSEFLDALEKIFSKSSENMALSCIALFDNLPEDYKTDYEITTRLAAKLLSIGGYEDAIRYARLSLADYGHVGLKAFVIIGRAYLALDQLDAAEASFKEALNIAENAYVAYNYLSVIYEKQQEYERFLKMRRLYLMYSRNRDTLQSLWSIAWGEEKCGNVPACREATNAILALGSKYKFTNPKELEVLLRVQSVEN
ncbi:MAG: SAM-dependent methyltransferase [Thiotrichaceae bacterium]